MHKLIYLHSSWTLLLFLSLSPTFPLGETATRKTVTRCPGDVWPPLVFHEETQRCYVPRTKGPCPNNLKILLKGNPHDHVGDCACDPEDVPPSIYHEGTQRCHKAYTRGFCKKFNQWLVFTNATTVECRNNPCVSSGLKNPVLSGTKRCVELFSSCTSPREKTGRGMVQFVGRDVVPTCSAPILVPSPTVAHLKCDNDSRLDGHGKCQKIHIKE